MQNEDGTLVLRLLFAIHHLYAHAPNLHLTRIFISPSPLRLISTCVCCKCLDAPSFFYVFVMIFFFSISLHLLKARLGNSREMNHFPTQDLCPKSSPDLNSRVEVLEKYVRRRAWPAHGETVQLQRQDCMKICTLCMQSHECHRRLTLQVAR